MNKIAAKFLYYLSNASKLSGFREKKNLLSSGNEIPAGTLFLKRSDGREMEIGFYEYGVCWVFNGILEFFTQGLSVRNLSGGTPKLEIRDSLDKVQSLVLSGDGWIASQGPRITFGFGGIDGDQNKSKPLVHLLSDGRVVLVDKSDTKKGLSFTLKDGILDQQSWAETQ